MGFAPCSGVFAQVRSRAANNPWFGEDKLLLFEPKVAAHLDMTIKLIRKPAYITNNKLHYYRPLAGPWECSQSVEDRTIRFFLHEDRSQFPEEKIYFVLSSRLAAFLWCTKGCISLTCRRLGLTLLRIIQFPQEWTNFPTDIRGDSKVRKGKCHE